MDANTIVGLSVGIGAFGILSIILIFYLISGIKQDRVLVIPVIQGVDFFFNLKAKASFELEKRKLSEWDQSRRPGSI